MSTINESTVLGEFAYWKLTTVIILTNRLLFSVPLSLLVNLSIASAIFMEKSLRTPLTLIHLSLLCLNCFIIIPDVITTCIFIPEVLRYCECDQPTSAVYFIIELYYFTFFPLNFACLGVFQLLIIKGKKRLVTFKSTTAAVIVCIVITTLVVSEGTTVVQVAGQTYVCNNLCPGYMQTQDFNGFAIAFHSYASIDYPSLLVVVVCTTWSCIIFKKSYTGGDDDLNRRMLSLPIVLPLILIMPTILSVAILAVVEEQLTSSRPTDYPYWVIFTRFISFQAYEIIGRIIYPLILLMFSPKIRRNWKNLMLTTLCKLKRKATISDP